MKTLIKLSAILALLALPVTAQEKQFAFAAAKHSYQKEGNIQIADSDAAAAERIAGGKSETNTEQVSSVQCSVAGGVCSTRCTTACSTKCNRW